MNLARRALHHLKATGTFVHTLFQHRDPIDWDRSVEAQLKKHHEALKNQKTPKSRLALYCYEGPHQGEIFELSQNLETLGPEVQNTQVISPSETSVAQTLQIQSLRGFKVQASPAKSFLLNGVEEQLAELYDFDELEALGSRFLVLDLALEKEVM